MKKKWKITYNAPVTLTFAILCAAILLLNEALLEKSLIPAIFTAPGNVKSPSPFDWQNPLDYLRLFTHVLGHSDWNHLIGNMSFILLLGPLMEERYGSPAIALMMIITALVTGVLNACLIPSSLLGASGIAFMLIILSSLSTIEKNVIPVSFLLVLGIYITREFLHADKLDNIATFAHIASGLCGSLFGFMAAPKKKASPRQKLSEESPRESLQDSPRQSPRDSLRPSVPGLKKNFPSEDGTIVGSIKL
ncbi:MAG: rhomboid family intramembrane serine protease [Treponema sp.]|nr:rhomboid family intramembrane serine protease [Treponema sp.]